MRVFVSLLVLALAVPAPIFVQAGGVPPAFVCESREKVEDILETARTEGPVEAAKLFRFWQVSPGKYLPKVCDAVASIGGPTQPVAAYTALELNPGQAGEVFIVKIKRPDGVYLYIAISNLHHVPPTPRI